jgi:hypothetical protein
MSTPSTHSITDKQGVVIVRGAAIGFVQEVVAGSHHFRTDEPAAVGGTDCFRRGYIATVMDVHEPR